MGALCCVYCGCGVFCVSGYILSCMSVGVVWCVTGCVLCSGCGVCVLYEWLYSVLCVLCALRLCCLYCSCVVCIVGVVYIVGGLCVCCIMCCVYHVCCVHYACIAGVLCAF